MRFVVFYPPLRAIKSIVCILIPLTSELLRMNEWATLARTGGLKGQTAPGDAHPYLALFGWKLSFEMQTPRHPCKDDGAV